MKQDEIATLVKYRLEQAQIALAVPQFRGNFFMTLSVITGGVL